jgi:predicted Zn-dependent protease
MLSLKSQAHSLNVMELQELLDARRRLGDSAAAADFLRKYLMRHPRDRHAWEVLAHEQEQNGQLIAAAATWGQIGAHFGNGLDAPMHQAELLWRAGQREQAFSLLYRHRGQATPEDVDYWELLGDQAWNLKRTEPALLAYRTLWKGKRSNELAAERLILLARDAGHAHEVITTAEVAFRRFDQPRLLLLAMDTANQSGLWQDLDRLLMTAHRQEQRFHDSEMYWLLRAQLAIHQERLTEAGSAYEQALQLNAESVPARVGLLWLLIQTDDKRRLKEHLYQWKEAALTKANFWGAYAIGLMNLGRVKDALPWFERQARANPHNHAFLLSYADALGQAGQSSAARRLDQYILAQIRSKVRSEASDPIHSK